MIKSYIRFNLEKFFFILGDIMKKLLSFILFGVVSFIGCSCQPKDKPIDPVIVPTPSPTPTPIPTPVPPPVVIKEKIVIVHFAFNSSKINHEQKKALEEVSEHAKHGTVVSIVGYTDSQGSKKYNKKLSIKRAKAVSKYLSTKFHIESTWEGKGESNLLNKDKTIAEHKLNRRADVIFKIIVQ
jgi:OOP family OmpA-OmpF porin